MRILLFDDESVVLQAFHQAASRRKHTLVTARTLSQAKHQLRQGRVEGVILDLNLQEAFGFALLEETTAVHPDIPIVVLTAENSIKLAVESMRRGACDYVLKPLSADKLEDILDRLGSFERPRSKVLQPGLESKPQDGMITFETNEPEVARVYDMAMKAARTEANVVLLGPSGTGKTVIARHIHANSPRQEHPFVVVHCPSLSTALLESELFGHVKGAFTGAVRDTWGQVARADKGTLFLDEIGDLPPAIQAKILRLVQEGEYERVGEAATHKANVRIIAATNADLEGMMREGAFREDLYYRLNVVTLTQPSLAQRPRDLRPMAERYIEVLSRQLGCKPRPLSPQAEEALHRYPWPGNFRELRNVIERALIFTEGDRIEVDALPAGLRENKYAEMRPGQPISLQALEEEHIRLTVEKEHTMKGAADVLGIDTATLYRKRKRMQEESSDAS